MPNLVERLVKTAFDASGKIFKMYFIEKKRNCFSFLNLAENVPNLVKTSCSKHFGSVGETAFDARGENFYERIFEKKLICFSFVNLAVKSFDF